MPNRQSNVYKIAGATAVINIETPTYPAAVALVDLADLPLVIDGRGRWSAKSSGKRNGTVYASRHIAGKGGRRMYMHHLLVAAAMVDHQNGNGLDNRRKNVRPCCPTLNLANAARRKDGNRYRGVFPKRSRWRAQIRAFGRLIYLGAYRTEVEAARAYDEAAVRLFGAFARPNFGAPE